MALFVVSDLHLCETGLARMFYDQEQGHHFAELCETIARQGGELILLGDIFDLTAATPPARGMSAFGRALEVPLEDLPPRELPQIMKSIRENNPLALDALERLSGRVPVTLVPGNHDRHLAEVAGRAALDAAGLAAVRIEPITAVRRLADKVVVLQHGHAWDPSNASAAGGGEVMTAVLHHAVIPFLRHLAPRSNVSIDPDRVVSLRPEERVVPVLERWLQQGAFETFLDAFLELLVENGYLSRAISWLATPDRIRSRLKDDDDLWERAGHTALSALEGRRMIPGRPPPPDVLVLGHTHVIDWAVQEGRPGVQRLYVNLGTWAARASDAAGPVDATLPVLEMEAVPKALSARLTDLSGKRRVLQSFEVTR